MDLYFLKSSILNTVRIYECVLEIKKLDFCVLFFERDVAVLTVQFKLCYLFVLRLSELPCLSFETKILTVM